MADIRHMIEIKASPETVFGLISGGSGFAQWWAEDVFDVSDRGCSLGFFNRNTIYKLHLESVEPGTRTVWRSESGDEWSSTTITFALEASGRATKLRFSHAGWRAETDYFTSCNTTWGELMFRLAGAAEGRTPGPLFRTSSLAY